MRPRALIRPPLAEAAFRAAWGVRYLRKKRT
jgi:hypothetical protein